MTRDESLHILQHALGLDDYGQGTWYRNHFVTGPDCDNWAMCMAHAEAGRMERHGPKYLFGGSNSYCFVVTKAGKAYVREQSPEPPRMTRAQKRYRQWLKSGVDMSLGDWLKCRNAEARVR